jgi:hypothetical protein
MHYNNSQRHAFNQILRTAQELGPKKYSRLPHPYGAIGDGRPRPKTVPASSLPSPEEETPASPPLTYHGLVVTSVPDRLERQSSLPFLPFMEEKNPSSPPLTRQESVATFAPDMWNRQQPASSGCYKADGLDFDRADESDSSTIGPTPLSSPFPPSTSDLSHPDSYLPVFN